ncbi:MAG: phosphomannomutase CpsG, partial [Paracoccaceae bacterium]|nr:phosphomannomutase CpsG [Paracoccaceae bacterium]
LTSCQGRLALQQGRRVNGRRMRAAFVEKVLSFLPDGSSNPLTILVNAGNGAAGPTVDAIISALQASAVPWHFIRHNHVPDTQFPKGIPNPLLRENRLDMTQAVRNAGCSFGVAWDGDFDRCFFFDERGCFIPGEYIVAILARHFCKGEKGKIVYDPRVTGCIESEVSAANGQAILSRCGHVFMKEAMQASGAAYGGERSGHHYFRDFMGCDSGMIPMLVVAGILAKGTLSLSEITEPYRIHFPSSEEINFTIESIENTMNIVMQKYADRAGAIDCFDGLSARFPTWRFNLRPSKTENCLRLCVESTRDRQHVEEKALEISNLINGLHARPTNQATSRLVPEG